MKQQTLAILEAADDPSEWESPIDFDWQEAMRRVRNLKPQIEQLVGSIFDLDENVQDASFFTDLVLHKVDEKSDHTDTILVIRFSAFGNLFTVRSYGSAEPWPPNLIKQVIALTEIQGYIYVDAEELNVQYTGYHEGFKETSWWTRFFDYV